MTASADEYPDAEIAQSRASADIANRLARCLTIICTQGDQHLSQQQQKGLANPGAAPAPPHAQNGAGGSSNAQQNGAQGWVTRFHAVQPPQVTVADYMVRLQKYFHCSNENFILAFVYLDRVITINPEQLKISTYIIHRLIDTAQEVENIIFFLSHEIL